MNEFNYDHDYKIFKKINEKIHTNEKYTYITFKHITNQTVLLNPSTNYFSIPKISDIAWFSGIIVKKDDSRFLENIIIEINGFVVSRISLKLLIKLYAYEIKNNRFFIPVPKKAIIFNKRNSFDNTIKQSYGFTLDYHVSIKIYVNSTHNINYSSVVNYTKMLSLNDKNLSIIRYDENFCDAAPFIDLISFYKFNINQQQFEQIKNNEKIIILCYDCCKKYSKKNKTLIHTIAMNKIMDFSIFPKTLCNLIVEYAEFFFDFKILVYDDAEYYLMDLNRFEFDNNGLIDQNNLMSRFNIKTNSKPKSKNYTFSKLSLCNIL